MQNQGAYFRRVLRYPFRMETHGDPSQHDPAVESVIAAYLKRFGLHPTGAQLNDERAVCDRLRIGRSTFKALTRSGALRVTRIGRSVRVSDAEIARFIAEREGRAA